MYYSSFTELLIIINLKGLVSKLFMQYGVTKEHMNIGNVLT